MMQASADRTYTAIGSCVLLATAIALAMIVYAALSVAGLVPPSVVTQDLVGLAF